MIPKRDEDLPASVMAALSQGQKIEAIKLLRESNGIGLKEAKDKVDEYLKTHPEMSMRFSAAQDEKKRTFFRWLTIAIVLSSLAYLLFFWK